MRVSSRFEYKYILPLNKYLVVRNALMPYLEQDEYTAKTEDGKYFVRSLYFDTHHLTAFHEREEGNYGRIKLRIRTYTDQPNDATRVSFELKTKKGNAMEKYSALVPIERYNEFLQNGSFDIIESPILEEFSRLYHIRRLQPIVLVEYEREGYVTKDRSPVRITFDHDVRSTRSKILYDDFFMMRPHRPKSIILEIKCTTDQPNWLHRIAKQYDLKMMTNSKYVQGIEIIRPMMITPNLEVE